MTEAEAGDAAPAGDDLPAPDGDFVTVDGLRLHYRIIGHGPKAVALHGASGNLREWRAGPAAALAERVTLLTLDRPGHGFSERPPGGEDIFLQARLMHRAAEALGFGNAPLIGHSMGGTVALVWAVQEPQAVPGMLLISAPSQVWSGGTGLIYDIAATPGLGTALVHTLPRLMGDKLIADALVRIFAPQSAPPGYAEKVAAKLALRPATAQANARDIARLKPQMRRMVKMYDRLTMPIELIHGEADKTVPLTVHSEPSEKQLPTARLTRLPGIGHMPHQVAPEAVVAALDRLLARIQGE